MGSDVMSALPAHVEARTMVLDTRMSHFLSGEQGAQPMPSQCLLDGKCQHQLHL